MKFKNYGNGDRVWGFSKEHINKVWDQAKKVDENHKHRWFNRKTNPKKFRLDFAGALIKKRQYGTEKKYGWRIDHTDPKIIHKTQKSHEQYEDNLEAIHWKNNLAKGDNYPVYKTKISAEGKKYNSKDVKTWEEDTDNDK